MNNKLSFYSISIVLWLSIGLMSSSCSKNKEEESSAPSSIEVIVEKDALSEPATIYLSKISGTEDPLIVDSIKIENGTASKFSFKPSQAGFYIVNMGAEDAAFAILDTVGKTEVIVSNNSDKITIKNFYSKDLRAIDSLSNSFEMEMQQLSEQLNSEPREVLEEKAEKLMQSFDSNIKQIATKLKPTIASIYAIEYLDKEQHLGFIDTLIRELKVAHPYGNDILIDYAEKIQGLLVTQEGQMAPAISQKTEDGKEITLANFKGKFVLLDFWASWCGPCRKESPNLVAFYNRTKGNSNFAIWSISLDEDRNNWLEAIKKDKLTWLHTSDLKGWNNEVARAFMVSAIPQTVLIGPDGKIAARNKELAEYEQIINAAKPM